MDDYKKIAHEKYLLLKKKEMEEETKQNELKKQQEFINEQMQIIHETINLFEIDKTDDNIMYIITILHGSIENIIDKVDDTTKNKIINYIIVFTNQIDQLNTKRKPGIDTIANVKILSEGFKKIYTLLNLNVEIITTNTEDDEQIARDLAKPPHLAKAGAAAYKRLQIKKEKKENVDDF